VNPLLASAVIAAATFVAACGTPEAQGFRRLVLHDEGGTSEESSTPSMHLSINYGVHARRGWTETPIVLGLQEGTSPERADALQRAAGTWNEAVGFPLIVFGEVVPPHGNALYDRLGDKRNSIAFLDRWCVTSKPAMVLATTIWEYAPNGSEAVKTSDIVLNEEYYEFADATVPRPQGQREVVDLESIALHELGHLLGLSHASYGSVGGVMDPAMYIGPMLTQRVLHPDDVARVRSIYVEGAPPPPPVSRPSWQPTSDPTSTWPTDTAPTKPPC